jgi:hypothetical protein
MRALILLLAGWQPPPAPLPPPPPPPAEGAAAPAAAPARPVYAFAGQPLKLPAVCADSEIQDFGLTCSEDDPCPLYLELAEVRALGVKLFLAGNLHTDSATIWSVLLASDDGGKSWSEPHERLRGAVLEHLQFLDFESGWVSGHLALALPRDPFLLRTSDGGRSWTRLPVFDEPRPSVIDNFYFESRTQGALVLDRARSGEPGGRFQRLESQDGGTGWLTREVSQQALQARPRRLPAPASDFRLRAEGASKSYRVERREGQRWVLLASFAISAGACKPTPPPPPPPTTEPVIPPPTP